MKISDDLTMLERQIECQIAVMIKPTFPTLTTKIMARMTNMIMVNICEWGMEWTCGCVCTLHTATYTMQKYNVICTNSTSELYCIFVHALIKIIPTVHQDPR
jgi:hypothetical protein